MNFFNDLLDVVTSPIKLTAKVVDDVLDSDIEGYIEECKDTIKLKD